MTAWGVLDFAGGDVVHISSGVSGLAASLVVGKRKAFGQGQELPPHNILLVFMGASLLWVGGWVGGWMGGWVHITYCYFTLCRWASFASTLAPQGVHVGSAGCACTDIHYFASYRWAGFALTLALQWLPASLRAWP